MQHSSRESWQTPPCSASTARQRQSGNFVRCRKIQDCGCGIISNSLNLSADYLRNENLDWLQWTQCTVDETRYMRSQRSLRERINVHFSYPATTPANITCVSIKNPSSPPARVRRSKFTVNSRIQIGTLALRLRVDDLTHSMITTTEFPCRCGHRHIQLLQQVQGAARAWARSTDNVGAPRNSRNSDITALTSETDQIQRQHVRNMQSTTCFPFPV